MKSKKPNRNLVHVRIVKEIAVEIAKRAVQGKRSLTKQVELMLEEALCK